LCRPVVQGHVEAPNSFQVCPEHQAAPQLTIHPAPECLEEPSITSRFETLLEMLSASSRGKSGSRSQPLELLEWTRIVSGYTGG
jgi:hypothetical protein